MQVIEILLLVFLTPIALVMSFLVVAGIFAWLFGGPSPQSPESKDNPAPKDVNHG